MVRRSELRFLRPAALALVVLIAATACNAGSEQATNAAQGAAAQRASEFQQSVASALSGVEAAARDARSLQTVARRAARGERVLANDSTPEGIVLTTLFASTGSGGGGLTYNGAAVIACFETTATWESVSQHQVPCPVDAAIQAGVEFSPPASGTVVVGVGQPVCYGEDCPGG